MMNIICVGVVVVMLGLSVFKIVDMQCHHRCPYHHKQSNGKCEPFPNDYDYGEGYMSLYQIIETGSGYVLDIHSQSYLGNDKIDISENQVPITHCPLCGGYLWRSRSKC